MTNPNTNCLEDMRCPSCGYYGPFNIEISVIARVSDEGTDVHGDQHWDNDSFCACCSCDHTGTVGEFAGVEPTEWAKDDWKADLTGKRVAFPSVVIKEGIATGGFGCKNPNGLGRAVFIKMADGGSERCNRGDLIGVEKEQG
jgi:hypothetical protein